MMAYLRSYHTIIINNIRYKSFDGIFLQTRKLAIIWAFSSWAVQYTIGKHWNYPYHQIIHALKMLDFKR